MKRPRPDRDVLPGILVALLGALGGLTVHHVVDALSPHVIAVALGVAVGALGQRAAVLRPGIRVSARGVLRTGIVLLGFRLSLADLHRLGPRALAAVVVVVAATFFGTQWLARRLGLSRGLGLLMATGYSICGASAIAAMEPFAGADEEDVAYSIALVTLCGTLAIGVLPVLGSLFGLGPVTYGAWVGASVHDVGQVVAAASLRGDMALRQATVVKLTRVALLAPLLAGQAVAARRRLGAERVAAARRPPVLPLFIVLFLLAAAIRSANVLDASALARTKDGETLLLGMGLFALGANVDVRRLRAVGGRPLALGLGSWALVAAVSLAAVWISGH